MSEVLKIRVIDESTGRELYTEKTVTRIEEYAVASASGCVQMNGQGSDLVVIAAMEPGEYAVTLVELVDTFTTGEEHAALCDNLATESLVEGSALGVLSGAAGDFMDHRNDAPILKDDIAGVAIARDGGATQNLFISFPGVEPRIGTLFQIFQLVAKKLFAMVPLVSTVGPDWKDAATTYADTFRKTRNANVRVNIKQTDDAAHKVKVLLLRED